MKRFCLRILALSSLYLWSGLWGPAAQASSWWQTPPESFENLEAVEYFLRWDHTDFAQRYSWQAQALAWWWGAPARAELPPKYQQAFSLRILPNHRQQQLHVRYHEQMVMDDSSHKTGHFTADRQAYQELKAHLNNVSCTHRAEPGWVGPAPQMLSLSYRNGSKPQHLIYASTSTRGPAGPSEEEYKAAVRRYLCKDALKSWLQAQILKSQQK